MIRTELAEAVAETNTMLDALLATRHGITGLQGAQLNYLCGSLRVNGAAFLSARGLDYWVALVSCFEAAVVAGATFEAMDKVRLTANAMKPTFRPGIAIKNFSVRMALAEQARILAATTFASRQDVDRYFDEINASFELAERVAANNLDNVAYAALIAIHAAVSNDLANRSRPLPLMVTYSFRDRMPSLWLAQRIYHDAARSGELIAENRPIHPLFMPSSGAALSI